MAALTTCFSFFSNSNKQTFSIATSHLHYSQCRQLLTDPCLLGLFYFFLYCHFFGLLDNLNWRLLCKMSISFILPARGLWQGLINHWSTACQRAAIAFKNSVLFR